MHVHTALLKACAVRLLNSTLYKECQGELCLLRPDCAYFAVKSEQAQFSYAPKISFVAKRLIYLDNNSQAAVVFESGNLLLGLFVLEHCN